MKDGNSSFRKMISRHNRHGEQRRQLPNREGPLTGKSAGEIIIYAIGAKINSQTKYWRNSKKSNRFLNCQNIFIKLIFWQIVDYYYLKKSLPSHAITIINFYKYCLPSHAMTKYFSKNACLAMALKIFKKILPCHGIK